MNTITKDEFVGLAQAANDAITDDMVGRLAETASSGLELLDRIQRAQLDKALPILESMVHTGDLQRLADYARTLGALEDALTDDMIGRLSETIAEGITVVDRLNRSGVSRLVDILDCMDKTGGFDQLLKGLPSIMQNMQPLLRLVDSVAAAAAEVEKEPAPALGLFGSLKLLSSAEGRKLLQFARAIGARMAR